MVNGGKVVEQGTHDELLKNAKGLYFKLVQVRVRVRVRVRARARVRARVRVRVGTKSRGHRGAVEHAAEVGGVELIAGAWVGLGLGLGAGVRQVRGRVRVLGFGFALALTGVR